MARLQCDCSFVDAIRTYIKKMHSNSKYLLQECYNRIFDHEDRCPRPRLLLTTTKTGGDSLVLGSQRVQHHLLG